MKKDSANSDSGKRAPKRAPFEYPLLAFALICAGVIGLLFAPFYLIPKFRPVIREFFAPLRRFLPGNAQEESNAQASPDPEDSDLPKAFKG